MHHHIRTRGVSERGGVKGAFLNKQNSALRRLAASALPF